MKNHIIICSLFVSFSAMALVDTKNGNYTKTYVDFSSDGFTLERAYNSRSIYRGLFGYGWCSNLETRVEVLPDNSLKVVECGGGLEVAYGRPNRQKMIQQIMVRVKKKKGLSKRYVNKLAMDLQKSSSLQSELMRAFGLKGKARAGQRYQAIGRPGEMILFTGSEYRRSFSDGKKQIFNKQGHLVMESDPKGGWMKIVRRGPAIQKVLTNKGLSWQFRKNRKKIPGFSIAGQSEKVTYVIIKDNLEKVIRKPAKGKKTVQFEHAYDDYHNMIKTRYSDHSYEALVYNEVKDWVTGFKDRRSCRESYAYVSNPRNKDHYWTDVKKICGNQVTNVSRYEFWNRNKPNGGGKYLYRARQSVNGQIEDMTFDARTGSPLSITRNRITTKYAYDNKTGLLTSRIEPDRQMFFPIKGYHKKCRKPQVVQVNYIRGKKVVRKVSTSITYHPSKCYLTQVRQKETGRWVVVKRDHFGRITEMYDQSRKKILVRYHKQFNKPSRIIRPGVGSIVVAYDDKGTVSSMNSKTDPVVFSQVTNVFNGFLEIISPVAANITI